MYAICLQGRPRPHRMIDIQGFFDAYQDGCINHKKYTSGCVYNFFGETINWMSKSRVQLQHQLHKFNTGQQIMEVRNPYRCKDYVKVLVHKVVKIGCDNSSASFLAKNPT